MREFNVTKIIQRITTNSQLLAIVDPSNIRFSYDETQDYDTFPLVIINIEHGDVDAQLGYATSSDRPIIDHGIISLDIYSNKSPKECYHIKDIIEKDLMLYQEITSISPSDGGITYDSRKRVWRLPVVLEIYIYCNDL